MSRAQMLQVGLTDSAIWWQLKKGLLGEALPGVYRLAGARRCWEQDLMVLCLWGGPGTVASHRSAAALWKFDGFGPGPLEISTLKQNRTGLTFKVHRTEVDPAFTTTKLGIPVTNALRTVGDLVYVLDETRSNQVVDEALRKGFASIEALWRLVNREASPGRRGVGKLRRLLNAAGLAFVEEYVITASDGTFVARADFKLLDAPVIIEAEGRGNHSSKIDWENDLTRRNRITAAGLATVHVTWDMAKNRSDEFLDEVRRVRANQLRRRA